MRVKSLVVMTIFGSILVIYTLFALELRIVFSRLFLDQSHLLVAVAATSCSPDFEYGDK